MSDPKRSPFWVCRAGSERAFLRLWHLFAGNWPEPEVDTWAFAAGAGRRWRFDLAWPQFHVAVEFQGVLYHTQGRHQRPHGLAADCEKLNAAELLGWRVLLFTPEQLRKRTTWVMGCVQEALQQQGCQPNSDDGRPGLSIRGCLPVTAEVQDNTQRE